MKIILGIIAIIIFIIICWHLSFQKEDVNRDGKVDIKDLLIVQKYILEEGEK